MAEQDPNAFKFRYAGEDANARAMRHSSFRPSESDFLDPSVLSNLRVSESAAEEAMARARKMYEEDLSIATKEKPGSHFGFDAWLNSYADQFAKMDPNSPEGQALNPIGTAELYREFSRLNARTNQRALGEDIKGQVAKLGAAGQTALGVFSAADEYARTASGGLTDTLSMLGHRIAGGEEGARKYAAGREFLTQLQEGANPTVRFARGFGGLLPFVELAGGVSKAAEVGRLALTGGKTALKEGTWRYGLNKSLAGLLGATGEGAGVGARMVGSAGNFLATDAALKVMNELNAVAQAKISGKKDEVWKQKFAELHGSPEWDLFQSALSGATMPFFGKLGDSVARRFSGRVGSETRQAILGKSLKEMGSTSQRVHAILARGTGGAVEFAGLSLLPNVRDPNGPFGVAKDFALLFSDDSDERSGAIERLAFHAANGFLLKNLSGKPVNAPSSRDRAAMLAPGVMRSGVADAMGDARLAELSGRFPEAPAKPGEPAKPGVQRTAEEEAALFFPTQEEVQQIRGKVEGTAKQKIADKIVRQYADSLNPGNPALNASTEAPSIAELMDSFTPEQRQWVTDAVNDAIRVVGSTGKGVSFSFVPHRDESGKLITKPKVVSYSAEAAGAYGLTPDERQAIRQDIAELVKNSTPEERDALAKDFISQQMVAEAAARMGMPMGDVEPGAIDSVLSGIADSVAGHARDKEAAGASTPDEAMMSRKIELEGLYKQVDAAQQAGNLRLATELAKKAAGIETELDAINAKENPPPEPQAGTAENPLTPGVKPKPLTDPSPGDVTWPAQFAEVARGQPVRVLVGETGDKQGVFRGGHILYVEPETGIAIVQTNDGIMFAVTPKDVSKGSVRGEIFTGIGDVQVEPAAPAPTKGDPRKIEHDAIRARGDTIEPAVKKPEKGGPLQDQPRPLAGLLGSGPTPPPSEAAPASTPSPGKPSTERNDVSPSATRTSVRFGSNRKNGESGSKGSGPAENGPPASTGSVGPSTPTQKSAKPEIQVSEEAKKATVPTPEWVKAAPDKDINAKIGTILRYMADLSKAGNKESPEYKGAKKVVSDLAKEAYRRRNPEKPKAEAPKPDAAAFKAVGEATKQEPVAETAKTEKPKKAPRFGSNRLKTDEEIDAQIKRIFDRQGKKIEDERKAGRTDPLTGVSNRASLEKYKSTPQAKGKHWAIVDLSSLGLSNNNLGEKPSDALLTEAAKRIQDLSGVDKGTIFRSGGDEFAVAGTPEQIVALGNALADLSGSQGLIRETETPYGKIHNRLIGGTGATYEDASAAMYRSKSDYAKHSVKQGYLDKTTDPSKGWRPKGYVESGAAGKPVESGPFPGEAAAGAPTPRVRTVEGMRSKLTLDSIPPGLTIAGAVKSGNSGQIFFKDKDGNLFLLSTGKKGVHPFKDAKQKPEDTKNVIVYDDKGGILYKAPTEIKSPVGENAGDDEVSKITTREQANARLGSFRRLKVEAGGTSAVSDPIRRTYELAGAMAADPKKPAAAVKEMMDNLYDRVTQENEKPNPNPAVLEKTNAAYDAVRRVYEAKKYIEDLDHRIKVEEDMVQRSAREVNPARLLSTSDAALGTSQRSARDLAATFKTKIDEEISRTLAGREVKSLPNHVKDRYAELKNLRKLADSLIQYSYTSEKHGRVDLSREGLPNVQIGDTVEVVAGGVDGARTHRGIVIATGEPSGAALKRGTGRMGQKIRQWKEEAAKGVNLTDAQKKAIKESEQFPGRYVTLFTEDGTNVRIRTSDITDIGPEKVSDVDFSYDPESKDEKGNPNKRGREVTETRFMSWFSPPEEIAKSRNLKGTGTDEQSINRTQMLMDGETEGYFAGDKEVTSEEAALLEAKNTASKIRNRTARQDQYEYQAMAMLVAPEDRKTHKDKFAARQEGVTEVKERLDVMTPEERADLEERKKSGGEAHWNKTKTRIITESVMPEDTFDITVHYFKPGAKLRNVEDLTPVERDEYDRWKLLAEGADAERKQYAESEGTYNENEKRLVPLFTDGDKGEWLVQQRYRGKGNVLYQGQTLLAERTPEGTVFVRRVSPAEAEQWMARRGKSGEWETFRKESAREHNRMAADNNRMISQATMNTQLRDYFQLMRKQFGEIINGRTEKYVHEGDLHAEVRKWRHDNPPPPKDEVRAYEDWLKEAENFLFAPPTEGREVKAVVATREGEKAGESVQGIEGSTTDRQSTGIGGPLYRAAERIRAWKEPNRGAPVRVDESGDIRYVNLEDKLQDFYAANQQTAKKGGVVLGMYGLGMMPGGMGKIFHAAADLLGKGIDKTLRTYHGVTRTPASIYSGVMDGVTNFTRPATDILLFDHINDLFNDPEYGRAVLRGKGKAAFRKMGVLFGESEVAPQMRIYHNDLKGDFLDVAVNAANALSAFRKLPFSRQRELMREFESGAEVPILADYKKIIDQYGIGLEDLGIFTKETTARFKGKYIAHSRWLWKQGDIEKNLAEAKDLLSKATDSKEKGKLRAHVTILENALSKATKSRLRAFLGDHPLDAVQREAVTSMYRKGFAREREHLTVDEAEKKGLDTSIPWALLMDGLIVEGRALAQGRMLRRVLSDPSIVKEADMAPHDWVPIEGTRYGTDPLFKDIIGKSIEPQALSMIEAMNPDRTKFTQAWDMVSGLLKSGMTVGNTTNWHTQVLGNLFTLAKDIPFFQIPSRLAQAVLTMNGIGKGAKERIEKYKHWNWTRHTGDAVAEMARMLDQGAPIVLEGEALRENPYLGMGFFKTIGEAAKRLVHGQAKQGLHGFAKGGVDFFTSLDALARIALHEYKTDTMRVPEMESRKYVDKFFDIENLPKGWKEYRRWENFVGIQGAMLRNLPSTAPGSLPIITNLALLSYFWNMAVGGLTGQDEEKRRKLIEASIPNNNAFHNWVGKKIALLMPDMKGSLRVIDMNKYSPMDTAIRAVPGLRPLVSGAENFLYEGRWAKDMDGKGFTDNLADKVSSNLLLGPQIDWIFDRDRYNPGRNIKEQMDSPGAYGFTGYMRYMIERGNLPGLISAALPPGVREAGAMVLPSISRNLRRAGEASDTGFLGTQPRYVSENIDGKPTPRKYDSTDAMMEAVGFSFKNPDEYERVREAIKRGADNAHQGKYGLTKDRSVKPGTPEEKEVKQEVSDDESIATLQKAVRFVAMLRHYKTLDTDEQQIIAKQIKEQIKSASNLHAMIKQLAAQEEFDLLNEISAFFEQDVGKDMIPVPTPGAEKMTKDRFGSYKK